MNSKYTDLSNSFPAAVDTIDKMQDLTITTKKKADKYYEYINANNITGANDYLGKSGRTVDCSFLFLMQTNLICCAT